MRLHHTWSRRVLLTVGAVLTAVPLLTLASPSPASVTPTTVPPIATATQYRVDRIAPRFQENAPTTEPAPDPTTTVPTVPGTTTAPPDTTSPDTAGPDTTQPTTTLPAPTTTPPPVHAEEDHSADEPHGPDELADEATSDGRTTTRSTDEAPFALFGLHLEEAPRTEGEVLVRFHQDDAWTEWYEVPGDHGPDLSTAEAADDPAFVSEPIWVGEADGYELTLAPSLRATAATAEVLLVRETAATVPIEERTVTPSSPATRDSDPPPIRGRAWWGAAPFRGTPLIADQLKLGLVHHTVTTNTYSPTQVPGMIRAIQAFHQDGNGWDDIAYNFVVDRYGTIWEGRAGGIDQAIIGGHARGFNTGSVGVVALGEFTASVPTGSMHDSIGDVLGWKMFIHGVDPDGRVDFSSYGNELHPEGEIVNLPRIGGHRDTGATACPGNQLYAYLGVIRAGAIAGYDARVGSGDFTVVGAKVNGTYQPLLGDFNGDDNDDILWYGPGSAADGLWYGNDNGTFTSVLITVRGTYEPIVGDFNGDWRDDILWYGESSDPDSIWYASRSGGFSSKPQTIGGHYTPVVGEFTGDDAYDVLWYTPGKGHDAFWQGRTDNKFQSRSVNVNGTYTPLVGDFDGDWRQDIFWYKPGAGADALWLGRPKAAFAIRTVSVRGTYDPEVGDFDGDGRDDVLWYGTGSATGNHPDSLWVGGGGGGFGVTDVEQATNGLVPLVGDFTGGGLSDVFWYGPGGAADSFWRSVGPAQFVKTTKNVSLAYEPFVGDFDGDDRDDVFWYGPGSGYDSLWLGAR